MKNKQEQYLDDKINMRELLTTLWGSKLLILAITSIFGIAGIVYAFWAPQIWSAEAIVAAPLAAQTKELRLRHEKLVELNDISTNNQTNSFSIFSKTKLFTDFIQAFDSFDNKSEFLLLKGYDRQENIFISQTKNKLSATLIARGDDKQEVGKLLKEYLNFIQTKEVVTKNKRMEYKIAKQTNTLTRTYKVQKAQALKRWQEDIVRTEFALRICRAAGIEAPIANLNNQSIFNIELGAKALNELLRILKEIKNLELINPALADVRLHLDSLRAVSKNKVSFSSYHFLNLPSEPLSRDKPKRSIVIILSSLAGLLTGVMVSLFRAKWLLGNSKED